MTAIEQQTRRRIARTGLTALDEERACPGYVVYTSMRGGREVYLLDIEGIEVHKWDMPYPPGPYGYLLPNGHLFYMGKTREHDSPARTSLPSLAWGGVMLEVDWNGEVLWEYRDPIQHHDARRTSSGGAIYLAVEPIPDDVAAKVKGGTPGSSVEGMWADVIVEVDASGKRVWEWHAFEHLDYETDVITCSSPRNEWTHGNSVQPLGEDRVLISCRNISTVGIIDKSTGEFLWKLGFDVLAQQHDPSMLPNGNVLIFDNGLHRKELTLPYSRVIEVDPSTNEIVWEYHDSPLANFFSTGISGARRLPNGNTFITEGQFGRMFQVAVDGTVVWEYINPHFHPDMDGALANSVFKANHYQAHEVPFLA